MEGGVLVLCEERPLLFLGHALEELALFLREVLTFQE